MEVMKSKITPKKPYKGLTKGISSPTEAVVNSSCDTENLDTATTTFTKIDFDKMDLFFKSLPNQISFDKVKIKNTGTTCIYFKWQKLIKPFNIPEKKSDGIDRFFCHYVYFLNLGGLETFP